MVGWAIADEPKEEERYKTFMGRGGKGLLHWEHWSCPDAETYLTGIDYYEHPRLCRERLRELYPMLGLDIPGTDEPKQRPQLGARGRTSNAEWGGKAPSGSAASAGFYNTTFMWPLLTFGWELFLECCLDDRFQWIICGYVIRQIKNPRRRSAGY